MYCNEVLQLVCLFSETVSEQTLRSKKNWSQWKKGNVPNEAETLGHAPTHGHRGSVHGLVTPRSSSRILALCAPFLLRCTNVRERDRRDKKRQQPTRQTAARAASPWPQYVNMADNRCFITHRSLFSRLIPSATHDSTEPGEHQAESH